MEILSSPPTGMDKYLALEDDGINLGYDGPATITKVGIVVLMGRTVVLGGRVIVLEGRIVVLEGHIVVLEGIKTLG